MAFSLVSILLSIALAWYVGYIINQLTSRNSKRPPIVFHWIPFVGSAVAYGMDPYVFFRECRAKYGDVFTFVCMGRKMTAFLGVQGNDFLFNGKLADLNAEEAYSHLTTPVFGKDVVYDIPNHVFMEHKKFIKSGLGFSQFRSYVPLILNEMDAFLSTSPDFGPGKEGVADLLKTMPVMTIYTASRTLQGAEVRKGFDAGFADLYHDLDQGFSPVNFVFPWLPLPRNRRRDRAHKIMQKTYLKIIKDRRSSTENPGTDMIWTLMSCKYRDGRPLKEHEIAGMMIALLMAGQHTSAATIVWVLALLGSKPEIIEMLWEEQKRVVGENLELKFDQYKDMPLLNYVIQETLRLHPPIHSHMRKVKRDLPVPGSKIVIPANNYLLAAPGLTATEEEYFTHATDFDPKRWNDRVNEDENAEQIDYGYGLVTKGAASPYLPFGAGRHRCIGEQFAYMHLSTIISKFVHDYTWTLIGKVPNVDYSSMVALPLGPVKIAWKRRN
ncbi:Lanosterol 14-alpha demethylase erg11 [Schizosaccharomyces pombe]|uniref:Lanosterol 14-alpha demethylase erg11 n=1 Tax=Schizosaccharomyces pombe (strain 972 / ATCC 24843) TaxID=284812 RepID=CP51_SCHPO|nr:putative sterol 14-demethylase [Schizosaccharomyces pombe]Q09736.1 RecName: Full=Lanosterol 14-alpha demethylase erg11; AltName: Full=Cytochrome P450 51; AltName: Full=Ergosterol biosynthetic protein 11; AltName: Full=Sterol 14-alpha demethylase [Schizosaccharomyces pombe 972h-]CAA90803.1 sterol 14-demethylase (predicted) [Schizosaccharomyces pombe]|eukprot:NP_592990.1 putative sterol 14-demethylase [Schizosaccharomyces pombe]